MKLVNVYSFYSLATELDKLEQIQSGGFGLANAFAIGGGGTSCSDARMISIGAWLKLEDFKLRSNYQVKVAAETLENLSKQLRTFINECEKKTEENSNATVEFGQINHVRDALRSFRNVLAAELGQAGFFIAEQKAAFDTIVLINEGQKAFPDRLGEVCPKAVKDAAQAMRCIAFDLPTAAAFHLHRLHELVLGEYWDHVTKKDATRPKNLGGYLSKMEKDDRFDGAVIACVRDIKNLHRNPVMHPEQSVENTEAAIVLQGVIAGSIGAMVAKLPLGDEG